MDNEREAKRKVLHYVNTAIRSINEAGFICNEKLPVKEADKFIAELCESLKPLLKIETELHTELFEQES